MIPIILSFINIITIVIIIIIILIIVIIVIIVIIMSNVKPIYSIEFRHSWIESHLRSWINSKFKLALLAVVVGEFLHEERSESGTRASAERMKDEKSLEPGALIREPANAIHYGLDDFTTDGIMASGIIVRCVFFARDQLLRMIQLSVLSGSNLVYPEIW